jgi:hypothetical protein
MTPPNLMPPPDPYTPRCFDETCRVREYCDLYRTRKDADARVRANTLRRGYECVDDFCITYRHYCGDLDGYTPWQLKTKEGEYDGN